MGRSKRTIEPLKETFGEAVKKVIRSKNPKEDQPHPKEQGVAESPNSYRRKRSKPSRSK